MSFGNQRISSTSSRTATVKKCPHIATLTSDHSDVIRDPNNLSSEETVKQVMEAISRHLKSGCTCMSSTTARIAPANIKLRVFCLKVQKNADRVADAETRSCGQYFDAVCSADEKSDTGHVTSSKSSKSASRLDPNHLPGYVNIETHNSLIDPLRQALDDWERVVKGLKDAEVKPVAIEMRLFEHLRTAFYICQLYRLIMLQERCARLARKVAYKSNEQLASLCMDLQLGLAVADTEITSRCIEKGSELIFKIRREIGSETMETIHFFLLRCESEIRNGCFTSGPQLTSLIASDYLKKMTVNRYFMKTMALFTCSRFPADEIEPSSNLEYFTTPLHSMYSMLKRWHRKVFELNSPDEKKDDQSDPIWFRYCAYELFCKSYVLYTEFMNSCGTPLESQHYHNVMMKFCRQNCLIYWLRKALIISAGRYLTSISCFPSLTLIHSRCRSLDRQNRGCTTKNNECN